MGTGRVYGFIWHLKVAWALMDTEKSAWAQIHTGKGPGHIQTLKGCPGTYRQWNYAWLHVDTGRVPRHLWAPERCPGTYGHQKIAPDHMAP